MASKSLKTAKFQFFRFQMINCSRRKTSVYAEVDVIRQTTWTRGLIKNKKAALLP